jgi:hypothetical protein
MAVTHTSSSAARARPVAFHLVLSKIIEIGADRANVISAEETLVVVQPPLEPVGPFAKRPWFTSFNEGLSDEIVAQRAIKERKE